MDRRALLGTLAAAVGPGCLRFSDGGSTPTATPAEDYPSGLTSAGVEPTLIDGHAVTLVDETFTNSLSLRNATDMRGRTWVINVGPDAISASFEEDRNGDAYGRRGATTLLWRAEHAGGWTYGLDPRSVTVEDPLSGVTDELRPIVAACDFDRPEPRIDEDGNRYFRISATEPDPDGGPALADEFNLDRLNDVDIDGAISPRGIIVWLRGDLTFRDDEGPVLVKVEFETRDVGRTTVDEPSWAGTARDRAPRIEVSFEADRQAVRFDHTGGDAVVAGTRVVINEYEGRGYQERALEAPLESGESLFAYLAGDGLRVARNGLPTGASPGRLAASDGHTALRLDPFNYARAELGEL